ncbi:MAG: hypothetical protein AAGA31_05705 [Bacteroidota bacterium]
MVTALCGTGCGATGLPPQSYKAFCDPNTFRKYGNPFFALVSCNTTIPDPSDLTAWQALVTSGDIVLGPKGKILLPTPTVVTSEDVDVCSGAVALSTTYSLNFTTYQSDDEDCVYWADVLTNHSNYRIIWFDCYENLNATTEYVDFLRDGTKPAPVGNPGFQFTIPAPPHPVEGDGKQKRWEVTFEIELSGSEIIQYAPAPGVFTQLKA